MITRIPVLAALAVFSAAAAGAAGAQDRAMPPETERQLAREIYKEMVEIKSGYTTGRPTAFAIGRDDWRAIAIPQACAQRAGERPVTISSRCPA